MGTQIGWRFCRKCQALVYNSPAPCVAGGQHDTGGSFNYALNFANPAAGQNGWRHCNKCHALAYGNSSLGNGACPAGGRHDHNSSFDYVVMPNAPGAGQSNWRYCGKCQGLTFAGGGTCAAGGSHNISSWNYRIDKEKYRVRVEAHRVHCGNTEDVTGADELYLVGAFSDGTASKALLTTPMNINDSQEKVFDASQRICFDAEVGVSGMIRGGIKAYDEDFGKDWAKYGETVTKISEAVATGLKSSKDSRAVTAGEILGFATKAVGVLAPLDKDDLLGSCEFNIPVQGNSNEEINWHFKRGGSGFSTWNYNMIVTINRS